MFNYYNCGLLSESPSGEEGRKGMCAEKDFGNCQELIELFQN